MRVAHIITRLLRGGADENTLLTSAGQIAAGHEVFILHGRDAKLNFALKMAPDARLIEIPALEREISPTKDFRAFQQLRSTLRKLRPDVVHTHESKAGILGRLAAASVGTRAVIHGVHILPFLDETWLKRSFYLSAEKATARITDAFIHVSDGMMSACFDHGLGADKRHHVVYSGFDIKRFAKAVPPDDWRTLLGVEGNSDKPPVVAMLAALEERKQHVELIERLPALLNQCPDVRIVFAGEGHLSDRIAQKITSLGLDHRVKLLGYRPDPERIIAMADVCLLCSRREGLPRAVIQYLAGGRPAVVFHLKGIELLIRDGHNGLILRPGDWDGLITSISGLLRHAPNRTEMSRHAVTTDLSPWDASLMASRTLAVYDEVLSGVAMRGGNRPAGAI